MIAALVFGWIACGCMSWLVMEQRAGKTTQRWAMALNCLVLGPLGLLVNLLCLMLRM